ncbi:MAG: hypothetical protein COB02_12660 [Candidatus Cloacimonadota bacterium]|nr:MAG: hypothetical protein COB02_12660 [Candidatus Cloacimonadota bacterium]
MRLQGKIAIISGGNRGLGLHLVKAFLKEGAKVAICARSLEALRVLDEVLIDYKDSFFYAACDITIPLQVSNLIKKVVLEYGCVNVLINNAAKFGDSCKIHECAVNSFNSVIETNLLGANNMVRSVLPHMLEQKSGKIIHITDSSLPMNEKSYKSAYYISKAGIETFSNLLSAQYLDDHIDCNIVDPSNLTQDVSFDEQKSLTKATELFIWLASIESNGLTGKNIKACEWLSKQEN